MKSLLGIELTIELRLFCFFYQYVFLSQVLLARSSVGTIESTYILYIGVKVNLYNNIEYYRKFQALVAMFRGKEQISSLKQPFF